MKKFKKEFRLNDGNEFVDLISNVIESNLEGDWSHYRNGETVVYSFNVKKEFEEESFDFEDVNPDSLFEFVGDGVCLVEEDDDNIWYNVEIKDGILLISYKYLDKEEDY